MQNDQCWETHLWYTTTVISLTRDEQNIAHLYLKSDFIPPPPSPLHLYVVLTKAEIALLSSIGQRLEYHKPENLSWLNTTAYSFLRSQC